MIDLLKELRQQHLDNKMGGMTSVCSAHPMVLEAAIDLFLKEKMPLLIEATGQQVNQFGGYAGITPIAFADRVKRIAAIAGFPENRLFIGADHLGPHPWKNEPAASAMQKAEVLVRRCVSAGFHKIHLDTNIRCADDPELSLETIVNRAARLCKAAEEEAGKERGPSPLYVIGDEAPVPGGGLLKGKGVGVTEPDELLPVIEAYRRLFCSMGLDPAWERVLAVVVQPGVDFGDEEVAVYDPQRAVSLSAAHDRLPGIMTFEIHATDYQAPDALKQMVRDHFLLLKTGPCLTHALCRALFALSEIEDRLPGITSPSKLIQVMEKLMTAHPEPWKSHYRGTPEELEKLRRRSLRDRIRYYWSFPETVEAVDRLMKNLHRPLPDTLLIQYFPDLYPAITENGLRGDPHAIVQLAIQRALQPYADACRETPALSVDNRQS